MLLHTNHKPAVWKNYSYFELLHSHIHHHAFHNSDNPFLGFSHLRPSSQNPDCIGL